MPWGMSLTLSDANHSYHSRRNQLQHGPSTGDPISGQGHNRAATANEHALELDLHDPIVHQLSELVTMLLETMRRAIHQDKTTSP